MGSPGLEVFGVFFFFFKGFHKASELDVVLLHSRTAECFCCTLRYDKVHPIYISYMSLIICAYLLLRSKHEANFMIAN